MGQLCEFHFCSPFDLHNSNAISNTLRPRQNGRHFSDDIFKCTLLNENVWISKTIWLGLVPKDPSDNNTILLETMAWCRTNDSDGLGWLASIDRYCVISDLITSASECTKNTTCMPLMTLYRAELISKQYNMWPINKNRALLCVGYISSCM